MASIRIAPFDTWQPGYGLATVLVLRAGTTTNADIFTDEALTQAAANPQTLLEKTDGGISYGKFAAPLYCGEPFQLQINTIDQTGIVRPALTTLNAQDGSLATVIPTNATIADTLADFMGRRIDVRDFGAFIAVGQQGASASTNNASLVAAIAVASAQGGGYVDVPGGTYQVTDFTLPVGVVVRGIGREGTTLQSIIADNVVTISGARAGFAHLTLDGVSQVATSVGIFAELIDQIVLNDVEIKRFETGLQRKGGTDCRWIDFYISDCVNGYQGHGDSDSGKGGALSFNRWEGGAVELCSTVGIELEDIDRLCDHNIFVGVEFSNNTGVALHVIGARAVSLIDCNFSGNTTDQTIEDGSPLNANQDNTVVGFEMTSGSVQGTSGTALGAINLSDTLESVAYRRVEFSNITITLTTPGHNVLAEDCREITGVTITGDTPTAWARKKTFDRGESAGITTGATATKAWGIELQPGQRVYLEGKVIARARNTTDDGYYHIAVSARRPGATLAYDTQTANFTAGNVLTGQTSKATARITNDADSGTFGTLTLQDVVGTFVDNEIIKDTGGGSATANGTTTFSNAALAGSVTSLRAAQLTDVTWTATFVANGPQIELDVAGAANKTVEWTADVDVVSS